MRVRVLGLMSGTSADGVDAAVVDVAGMGTETEITVVSHETYPYSDALRERLLRAVLESAEPGTLALWRMELGEVLADVARVHLAGRQVDLIASHGHTFAHVVRPSGRRATLQLGSAAAIAAGTGTTVVSDFRTADTAVGGQGAPLVSYVDWVLLRDEREYRVAVNIGGIANLTWLPPKGAEEMPVAFDTGPGNTLIDHAAWVVSGGSMRFDLDGRMGREGRVDEEVLRRLLDHPYFALPAPKSTGKEEFTPEMAERVLAEIVARGGSGLDAVATLTALTSRSLAAGILSVGKVDRVLVAGGGAHNLTLLEMLRGAVGQVEVETTERYELPVDGREAVAFAVLGAHTIQGVPANLPSCTGAARPVVLGAITPGANYRELMTAVFGQ